MRTERAGAGSSLDAWLGETRDWVEGELDRAVPAETESPVRLHRAMRHALFGGGKRLRPALTRLLCLEGGGDDRAAAAPAVAVELVHTYSLVHDDLPCMDDDDLRRGRPTCHVAFDEATAVLAGDALLTLAFGVLSRAPRAGEMVASLASAAGAAGMVGGQELDLHPPGGADALAQVRDLHRRKTAALFGAAAEMGALAAGGDPERRTLAREFGLALGTCFQAVDDLLDVTGDAETLGKTPGKDAVLERRTLVSTLGVDGARGEAEALGARALALGAELGWQAGERGPALVRLVLARRA